MASSLVTSFEQGDFVKRISKRLTYANVMSSIAVFLVVGGGAAIAAKSVLPKKSVGTAQLKAKAVSAAKLKKNAVTKNKIRKNAVNGSKIADGSITGAEINLASLGTVPNSATTDEVRSSRGTVPLNQQATIFEYGGVRLVVVCEPFGATEITGRVYIESSAEGTTFLSWMDASKALGPATLLADREVTAASWGSSEGPLEGEAGAPINVTTAAGASFSGHVGVGSEKDSSTCFYWFHGTIIS